MAQLKELGTLYPPSLHDLLDGLTFHSSPRLQSGLGQNELWRRLRQDVVAKYLLGWRWRCGRHAHRVQKHWSALLVLRPNWCMVVNVLEASRDLNRKKDWRENKRLMVWSFQHFYQTHFVHMEGINGTSLARTYYTKCSLKLSTNLIKTPKPPIP